MYSIVQWMRIPIAFATALIVLLSPMVIAQNRAPQAVQVSVTDPAGAAVAGARVSLQDAGGKIRSENTNKNGEASFRPLPLGHYTLSVEAKGFVAFTQEIQLDNGLKHVPVKLEVSGANESMAVKESEKEKLTDQRGDAFATVLTEKQIAEMPDDPDEFKRVLNEMAGPGGVIRVNGFTGGQLPPKSQIRGIRINRNPYAAEFHDVGFISIDIRTKPGVDLWHGTLNFGFRDGALNARNAFAPVRGPQQYRRFGLDVESPIWKNHTSLFLSAQGNLIYDSKTIVAALPNGSFNAVTNPLTRNLNLSARVEHALTKTHTLRGEYQRNALLNGDLGVGNFDLPERSYSTNWVEHLLRLADTGLLTEKIVNEIRFQASWQNTESSSATQAPAVLVLNAFDSGGAQVANTKQTASYELADNLDFAKGKQSFRAGILGQLQRYNTTDLQNTGGTFTFSSLAAFEAAEPLTFTQRIGNPTIAFSQYEFGWYAQDSIRVSKGLSVDLGFRHDFQSHISDRHGFAPRLGIAWSPDGKTVFRGGAGIFYDWLSADTYGQVVQDDGFHAQDLVIQNPGYPNPFIGGSVLALPPGRTILAPDLRLPYLEQASFGVQRALPGGLNANVSYVYRRGVHLLRGRDINAPFPGVGRPDPDLGNIVQVESTANSYSHMMVASVSRISEHFSFFVNYMLSSAKDETDGPLSLPANNFDLRAELGPSSTDVRHRLFAYFGANPFGGLSIGTMFNASSGTPYNITTGFDNNGDTVINDRPVGVGRNSARGAGQWDFSTRVSYSFAFGKARSGAAKGPMVKVVGGGGDILGAVGGKSSNQGGLVNLQIYVQAYNLFNHTNPTNYSGVETSPFFGLPTAALQARRIEAGLRARF